MQTEATAAVPVSVEVVRGVAVSRPFGLFLGPREEGIWMRAVLALMVAVTLASQLFPAG